MLISDKQQSANRENATHSTGPKTTEGKARVRLNALTYGLCARSILITGENPDEYKQLYADLESDWQPQSPTEKLYLQHLVNAQWLIVRMTVGQSQIHDNEISFPAQLLLLERVSRLSARYERSAAQAIKQLEHLQSKRETRETKPIQAAKRSAVAALAPQPTTPNPPPYLMSDSPEAAPLSCSPLTPDIR